MDETKPFPPVFVDVTGRRRRRLRRVAYVFGSASLVYTGLVGAGFSGGSLDPQALLPLPDLLDRPETAPSTQAPSQSRTQSSAPAPTDTSVVVNEAIPAPTTPPPQAAALAVLAGFGPAAGRPLEHLAVTPAPTGASSPLLATEPTEPTRPGDGVSPAEPAEPAEPVAATPEPEPSASETSTGAAANTVESPAAAAAGTPEASHSLARQGRRPSPRPVASPASR